MLPTVTLGKHEVTRLICGGNPFSGFSHISSEVDEDFLRYYTMPNLLATLDECWKNGINTFLSRGDRHQTRMFLEHQINGGQMQWIAQTQSEIENYKANIAGIMRYKPIAIYHHGTHADNFWHAGRYDEIADIIKCIKDTGLPAGLATHIPEAIDYAEDHQWGVDFYMASMYNLARGPKLAVAVEKDAYRRDIFPPEDPPKMAQMIQKLDKPCLAFKIMACGRNCVTPQDTRSAIKVAFDYIKPTDAVVVGMFQKHRNQVQENAQFTSEVLCGA